MIQRMRENSAQSILITLIFIEINRSTIVIISLSLNLEQHCCGRIGCHIDRTHHSLAPITNNDDDLSTQIIVFHLSFRLLYIIDFLFVRSNRDFCFHSLETS